MNISVYGEVENFLTEVSGGFCENTMQSGLRERSGASLDIYRCRQIQPSITGSWGKESYLGVG